MNWHRIILVFLMTILIQYNDHMVSCVITDVRLVGGPASNKGTVEVRQDDGKWETTCGINLDTNDVIVICRQLGFAGASLAAKTTPYGQNSIPDIGLGCDGNEANLSACSTSPPTSGCSLAGSASCHGDGYLGCFVDVPGNRVLSGNMNMSQSMSISYCIQFCQESTTANYIYAGVEGGYECYCGEASDNYTRHGVGVDSNCSFPCHGDPTESCGGSGYIAVFTTPLSTTSIVTSTNQVPTTNNGDRISSSSPPPQPPPSSSSPSSSPSSSSSSPPPPSSSPLLSSSLKPQGTSNLHTAGNSTGLYAGIGGGVAAVVIIIIVIVAIACIRKRRSQQRKMGIASSQEATLTPVSRPPAYDEINDFGIPNGAMAEASSARSFQPGAQAQSNANSSRGNKNVLLVNLNPRKSSNIYEGTMDETPDDEPTQNPSRGTTAVPQNSNDRLSVLYAIPDKMANGAQDGYDEINIGIAPYSSFENPKQPTATTKKTDRMSVVYAAPDKNLERNGASEDMDSRYAMPDKNGNRNNPSDDTSEDVGSLYAMPDKSRGNPDGYDGDQDLYAVANDSFSGDQFDEMEMVDNELYTM
nr:uncharacterized protein LOC129280020 [Lytechinus pictus]